MDRTGAYDGDAHGRAQLRGPVVALLALLSAAAPAESNLPALERQRDTIVIHAREARQSDDGSRFDLSGDLRIRGADWQIRADSAVISGRLEDPDRIEVAGGPASISIQRANDAAPLRGSAEHLEFDPRRETIKLNGDARIEHDRQSITSDAIRYLLQRDTFASAGDGRVKVVTRPKNGSPP